jgi:peptidoglycan/xylan/chitin deacetylase (PgdA/CDA1 family)
MSLILLYHRINSLASDPQLLCVSPEHFAEHLQIFRKLAAPQSLETILNAAGEDPKPRIALTFDDGYADNATQAAPLLHQYDIPATIFATTALTGTREEFFWDELEQIFLEPGQLPDRLSVGDYQADLKDAASYSETDFSRHSAWNVLEPLNPTTRQKIYRELTALIHKLPIAQRNLTMAAVRSWARQFKSTRQTHCMMSPELLREVSSSSLIAIGGHTVDHPVLSDEDPQSQRHQIVENKAAIEEIIGRPISAFAYPFGTRKDYTQLTISLVKEAGYALACSNFPGRVSIASDPHQLPRHLVRNWPGAEFERRLRGWLSAAPNTGR